MDFLQMRYCLEAAKYKNFTRAAEQCYVSQSVISVQIGKLETELGIRIFSRTQKGVAVTKEGEVFLEYAGQMLALEERMKKSFRVFQNSGEGSISIGLAQCSALYMLTDLVSAYQKKFPDVELSIQEGDSSQLKEMIRNGVLDAAFLSDMLLPDDLRTYELLQDEVVLVVGKEHPLAGRESVQLEELRGHVLLFSENSSILKSLQSTQPALDAAKRGEEFFRTRITKNTHILTNISLVANGLVATLVTRNSAGKYGGKSVHVAKLEPSLSRYVYLAVSEESAKVPVVDNFIQFVLDSPHRLVGGNQGK